MTAALEILRSPRLGRWPHGFTTRGGGCSAPPLDALNLGDAVGDDPACVAENWARLRGATGLGFARVRQVHGDRVVEAARAGPPEAEADAVVSAAAGVAACVSVADCAPILVADPDGRAVAAVHAGWRGTLARAAARAVEALARGHGARPERLLAAVGPAIGPCCYEVSPDLAARFREAFGPATGNPSPAQARVDLWLANARVLVEAGLRPENVDLLRRCTSCEAERFFSHRRDAGRTGRQVGFIAPLS